MVLLCLNTQLIYLLEETTLEATQDSQNRATNKLVVSVKYIWILATELNVELGVDSTHLNQNVQSLSVTEHALFEFPK